MLESMVCHVFKHADFLVRISSLDKLVSETGFSKDFDAVLTSLPELGLPDGIIQQLLTNHPGGLVICVDSAATTAKVFSLKLDVSDLQEVSAESLTSLVREYSSWQNVG